MAIELHEKAMSASTSQAGVLSRAQLMKLGFADSTIREFVRSYRFANLARGVYNTVTGEPTLEARRWAAHLRCGPESFIFAESALELWGVDFARAQKRGRMFQFASGADGDRVHVAVPNKIHLRVAEPWIHVSRVHSSREVVLVGELPVETSANALLDVAGEWKNDEDLQNFVLSVVQGGRIRVDNLELALDRRKIPRRTVFVETIELLKSGVTSALEKKGRLNVLEQHGLPLGEWQKKMVFEGESRVVDVYFEEYGVIVEFDGQAYHDSSFARTRDRAKDNVALDSGIVTFRVSWHDATREPCATAKRLSRVLQGRGWSDYSHGCHRKACSIH